MIYGMNSMTDPRYLPILRPTVRTHYEGSIDKAGGNADWDWWLYQDEHGEWVLFDVKGPGCLYNFVQHRYPDSAEPTFRFYFDGEETPRFTIRHSQFGEVYPLVEPMASRYIGPPENGRGPIRVVRSFLPMPFARSCRITSDIRLEGFERAKGQGGWGHVIYQTYPADTEIRTFNPQDSAEELKELWKQAGTGMPLLRTEGDRKNILYDFTLKSGEEKTVFSDGDPGTVTAIRVRLGAFSPEVLSALSIRAVWDDHEQPDVNAPFGCFFTNELGFHSVRYLFSGMTTDGDFYQVLPMPYHTARIAIVNSGPKDVAVEQICVTSTDSLNSFYAEHPWGFFRTSAYYPRQHTEGRDSIIARVAGSGHLVGSVITAHALTDETYASCEGDVRIHFNGIRTPQIESDGSESYSCYGWGFPTPPETNPASGYDGFRHRNWSMTRWLPGDVCPFTDGFVFGIESGGNNDSYLTHSGMAFYYGNDAPASFLLGEFSTGDEELTAFFEGDDDDIPVTARGSYGTAVEFTVDLPEGVTSVVLRRLSDQKEGRQEAEIFADGEQVPFPWYFADRNPIKRWLEDEFVLPLSATQGKERIHIRILPVSESWNCFGIRVYGVRA